MPKHDCFRCSGHGVTFLHWGQPPRDWTQLRKQAIVVTFYRELNTPSEHDWFMATGASICPYMAPYPVSNLTGIDMAGQDRVLARLLHGNSHRLHACSVKMFASGRNHCTEHAKSFPIWLWKKHFQGLFRLVVGNRDPWVYSEVDCIVLFESVVIGILLSNLLSNNVGGSRLRTFYVRQDLKLKQRCMIQIRKV